MNASLDRLVARNLGEVLSLRPRPVSLFEPEASRLDQSRNFPAPGWGEPIRSDEIEREVLDETPQESTSAFQAGPSVQNKGMLATSGSYDLQKDPYQAKDFPEGPHSSATLNRVLRKENRVVSEEEKAAVTEPRAHDTSDERSADHLKALISRAIPVVHDVLAEQHSMPNASAAAQASYRPAHSALREELASTTVSTPTLRNQALNQNVVVPSTAPFGQSRDQRSRNSVPPFMATGDRRAPYPLAKQPDPSPSVQVTIGRIEIRAETPASAGRKMDRPSSPVMGLDEYLRQKNTRGGK
jgi:hypothetical protein